MRGDNPRDMAIQTEQDQVEEEANQEQDQGEPREEGGNEQ